MIREWTVLEAQTSRKVADFMKAFEQATELVKVDSDYTFNKYMKLMESGVCHILIAEDEITKDLHGAIGFLVVDDFHQNRKVGVESFWFVHPSFSGCGKELFNAYEEYAKELGCTCLAMIHLSDSYPERLERFYVKNGYKLTEKHYTKEV